MMIGIRCVHKTKMYAMILYGAEVVENDSIVNYGSCTDLWSLAVNNQISQHTCGFRLSYLTSSTLKISEDS